MSDPYKQQVMNWRREKDTALRTENGWLALAGLFWLKQGENRAGSDPGNDILLPARIPGSLGTFILEGEHVKLDVAAGAQVLVDQHIVESEIVLRPDTSDDPSYITI